MFSNYLKFSKINYSTYKFELTIFCVLIIFSTLVNIYQFNNWQENYTNYPYVWASNTDTPDFSWGGLLSGDEPNYLVVTSTLINHNSVNLVDFYHSPYRDPVLTFPERFYSDTPYISNPWQGWRIDENSVYSIHEVGLSVLMIPGYFLGGVFGAMMTTSLFFSLTGLLVYKFSSKLTNNKISFFATIIFFLGTILFTFSGAIYPDIIVTFFLMMLLYLFFFKKHDYPHILSIGVLLGFTLFLKFTFILLPLIIIPIFGIILFKKNKNLIFPLLISFVMVLILFIAYNYSLFENPSMLGGYHSNLDRLIPRSSIVTSGINHTAENLFIGQLDRISVGLVNYLFGPTYGLFVFSPLAIISIFGFSSFWKNNKQISITILCVFLGFLFVMVWGQFPGGAWSMPSRYILPIIPLLVIPLSYFIKDYSKNILLYSTIFLTIVLGLSFNSIFSNVIHGHLSTFDRSNIMSFVYGPLSEIFPYPNDACYRCNSEYIFSNTNPVFWIFVSSLIVIFLLITMHNAFRSKKLPFILFFIVLLMMPSLIIAGATFNDYKINSTITTSYFQFLQRQPEKFELEQFKTQVLENGKTLEWVKISIQNSEEAKSLTHGAEIESQITEFYVEYLHRTPDIIGLVYFKTQVLENGKTLEWVKNAIQNSEEAKNLSLKMSNSEK